MSASVIHHIARRGVDCGKKVMAFHSTMPQGDPKEALDKLAKKLQTPGAIITFVITGLAFLALSAALEYSIRVVAVNLAIVEDTETNGAIKLPLGDDDMAKMPLVEDYDGDMDERVMGQHSRPVTSGIRSTFRHIQAIGGFRARFRGLLFGIFYGLSFGFFNIVLTAALSSVLSVFGVALAQIGAAVATCNLHATWTHATIAMPSEKPFMQRFLPTTVARKLIFPTIRYQISVLFLQLATGASATFARNVTARHGLNALTGQAYLLPVVAFALVYLFHVLPSQMALIRSEASLLPEDMSAIVSFDRTFGGRFDWEAMAERKTCAFRGLLIRGAYMAFDKPTYMRVVKMLVKLFMIMTTISVAFLSIFAVEFYAFAGKEAKNVHAHIRDQN